MMKTFRQSTNAAIALALFAALSCLVKAQEFVPTNFGFAPREPLGQDLPTILPPTNSPPTTAVLVSSQPEDYALKKMTVTPLNATAVEIVFVLPSFAVNRKGKAELNYTGLPLGTNADFGPRPELPPDNAVWLRRQNIKTQFGIFPRSNIKYYLGNLKPNFRYWFKLSVHFQDNQEPPFDEPLEGNMEYVDMPQNLVPFTTTTTAQPTTTEPSLPTQPSASASASASALPSPTPTTTTTTTTTSSTSAPSSTTTNSPEPTIATTTTTRASTTVAQSITIKPMTATSVTNTVAPTTARSGQASTATSETTPQPQDSRANLTSSPLMSSLLTTILNATQPISVASPPVPSLVSTVASTATSSPSPSSPSSSPSSSSTTTTTSSTTTTSTTTTTTTSTTTTPPPASSTELLTSTESSGRSVSISTLDVETPELSREPSANAPSAPIVPVASSAESITSTVTVLASSGSVVGAASAKPPLSSSESLVTSEQNSTANRKPPVTPSWFEQLYLQLNVPIQRYALCLLVAFVVMTILFIFVSYKYFKKSSRVRMAQITSQPAYDNPSFTKLVSYYANQNYHNDALLAKQKNLEVDKTSPFHAQHNQLNNDIHHNHNHHHHNQNGKHHLI